MLLAAAQNFASHLLNIAYLHFLWWKPVIDLQILQHFLDLQNQIRSPDLPLENIVVIYGVIHHKLHLHFVAILNVLNYEIVIPRPMTGLRGNISAIQEKIQERVSKAKYLSCK